MTYTPTLLPSHGLARASAVNAELQAIAAELANLPSGSEQAQGTGNYWVATGAADTYAITISPAPLAYEDGMEFNVQWSVTNTGGAATLNVNGLGARSIKYTDGGNPEAGAMSSSGIGKVILKGTTFYLISSTTLAMLATKQADASDTTSGAALIVGAFGLGETGSIPALEGSIDATDIPSGDWSTSAATTGTFPSSAATGLLTVKRLTAAILRQTWEAANSHDRYRRYYNGSWTAWTRDATASDLSAGGTGSQPLDATLTAFAALSGSADKLAYFSGADTFALATLTSFARTLLDDTTAATARSTLGLGDAATQTITSGDSDTTSGRLLKVGDYGLGSDAPTVGNLAVTTNALHSGFHQYQTPTSSGGPTGATKGVVWHERNTNGEETQFFLVVAGSAPANPGVVFTRYRVSSGAWSSWKYPGIYDFYGDTADGYIKFDNGLAIAHAELDESASNWTTVYNSAFATRSSGLTWTFPFTFSDEPRVIAGATDANSTGNLNGCGVSAISTTSCVLWPWSRQTTNSSVNKFALAIAIGHWRTPS